MKAVETSNTVHDALAAKHDELHLHITDGERLPTPKGNSVSGQDGPETAHAPVLIALTAEGSFETVLSHECAVESERLGLEASLKEKMQHVQV